MKFSGISRFSMGDLVQEALAEAFVLGTAQPASEDPIVFQADQIKPKEFTAHFSGEHGYGWRQWSRAVSSAISYVIKHPLQAITAGLAAQSAAVMAFNQTVSLSTLGGQTGFILTGGFSADQSGSSVAGVGDVNGDGIADLMIGGPYANSRAGATYVVLGIKVLG